MSVVVVVTAFPIAEHRAEVVAAFEEAIARVHEEPGVELYALHEGPDRLVMIEKYESEQARSEHRDVRGAAVLAASHNRPELLRPADVSLPAAVTVFPEEYVTAPRSWTEQAYRHLIYFNEAERGGHFAA